MSLLTTLEFITSHPLNAGNPIGAVYRFASWQLRSRFRRGAQIHKWVNGARFWVRRGETGLTGNVYTGLHEFADMAFLLHFLRREDLFVDVGANVGSYTILAWAAVGARAKAFEPVPATYERLVANIELNEPNNKVDCINKGVGASEGSLVFSSDGDTTNHALAVGEACVNVVTVPVTTLDSALAQTAPALIKIDVEGYETPVLSGAEEVLRNPALKALIIELNGSGNHYGFDERHILKMLQGHGFDTYSYEPFSRTLQNLDGKNSAAGNTLFIRDLAFVTERLHTAPLVSLHGKSF